MDVTYKDLLAMIGEREMTIKALQQEIEALKATVKQLEGLRGQAKTPKNAKGPAQAS